MSQRKYLVHEAEFLLSLGESEHEVAKRLNIRLDTLEKRWREERKVAAPWVARRMEMAELGLRKPR